MKSGDYGIYRDKRQQHEKRNFERGGATPATRWVVDLVSQNLQRSPSIPQAVLIGRQYALPPNPRYAFYYIYLPAAPDDLGQCVCNGDRYAAKGNVFFTVASLKCHHMSCLVNLQINNVVAGKPLGLSLIHI